MTVSLELVNDNHRACCRLEKKKTILSNFDMEMLCWLCYISFGEPLLHIMGIISSWWKLPQILYNFVLQVYRWHSIHWRTSQWWWGLALNQGEVTYMNSILAFCFLPEKLIGKDEANDFKDMGHGDWAKYIMEKHLIGEINTQLFQLIMFMSLIIKHPIILKTHRFHHLVI